jgi:hypothetical protein
VLRHFDADFGLPVDGTAETPLETLKRLIGIWKAKVLTRDLEGVRLLVSWVRAVEILGGTANYNRNQKIGAAGELLRAITRNRLGGEALLADAAEIVCAVEAETYGRR